MPSSVKPNAKSKLHTRSIQPVPRDSLYLVHAQALKEWMTPHFDQPEGARRRRRQTVLSPERKAVNLLGVLASIKHIGRRSGQEYVTPVLAVRFGDGFVVPLAYGMSVDWFRNVMAARGCKLVWKKQEYLLEKPEVLTLAQTKRAYPWPIRWIFFAGGVSHHVFLHQQAGDRKSVPTGEDMSLLFVQ